MYDHIFIINSERAAVNPSDQTCNEDTCRVRVIHADKIEQARQNVVPDDRLDRLALIYRMLGDPTRLKILMALKQVELCVCDIAAFLGISESAVSHQLRRLRETAIVRHRREGQVLYYMLNDMHVETLLDVGIEHAHERVLQ
jgi:ArsR family transcriptional regulator, lead/cadmium/zinc/bismuth-responsive transcriptional repressor